MARHFSSIPVLTTDRLVLRGLTAADAADVAEITTYNGVYARNASEALEYLEHIHADFVRGESLHWGIFGRDGPEVFGTCGFYRGFESGTGEVGYVLRAAHRGKGIMTEAVCAVVDFGFSVMKLNRVIAITDPMNRSSIAVLERAGFQRSESNLEECRFVVHPRG